MAAREARGRAKAKEPPKKNEMMHVSEKKRQMAVEMTRLVRVVVAVRKMQTASSQAMADVMSSSRTAYIVPVQRRWNKSEEERRVSKREEGDAKANM